MTEMSRTRTRPDDPGLIGQVLGNYRIVAPLSSGGMGAVFRATHETLGKSAAIKVLRPELTGNHELVQRFFTEAKAASAMRHPGIVEIYDFGYTDDGLAFIVMELLDGQSLAHRLADRKRLPELHAAAIARGIASALTAAHGKGIIHRDLKPDNIFLVPDPDVMFGERPKILDFGIAKLTDPSEANIRHTRTGALIGTPLYMAPEQARAAGDIDARADLYSLGCILYELLVGAPPFVAEGAGEIIAMQMFATPEPPSARLPSLAPALEAITLRLLDKEPAARFASAAETADALGSLLGQLSDRLSTVVPGAGASLPAALFTPPPSMSASASGPGPAPGAGPGSAKLPLLAETPPPAEPKRSALMPLLAGVLTVAIAGTALAFVFRGGAQRPAATVDAGGVAIQQAAALDASVAVANLDASVEAPVARVGSGSGFGSGERVTRAPQPARPHPGLTGPSHVPVVAHDPRPAAPAGPVVSPDHAHDRDPQHDRHGLPIEPTAFVEDAAVPSPAPAPAPR